MSFLAPFFLIGIALVAGPILFHLMRQAPRNRVVFSSTDLLEPSQPKHQTSRRVQNPWLLLIRCLIIALLAFAFARPFIPTSSQNTSSNEIRRDVVIALDQSASMNRTGVAQGVIEEAISIVEALKPKDQLSVFGFTDRIAPILSNEQWLDLSTENRKAFVVEQLRNWKPLNYPGEIDLAISEAVSEIEGLRELSSAPGYGEVYIISDFAEGTSLNGIELIDWPTAMRLTKVEVQPAVSGPNLSLRWLHGTETEDGQSVVQIVVTTTQPQSKSLATISIENAVTGETIGQTLEVVIEDEAQKIVSLPIEQSLLNSPISIRLEGDQQEFDNLLPIAPEYIPEVTIGLLSSDTTSAEKAAPYFVAKGVQGFESPRTQIDTQTPTSSGNDAFLIDRSLSADETSAIRAEIGSGKSALILARSIDISDTLRALTGNDAWVISDRPRAKSLLIGEVDFGHPLFAPFASPRYSNFANINIWKAPEMATPDSATILARFDDKTPLLSSLPISEGTLYVWTGSWDPADSQWVLSSKFIPFLHRFILGASGGPAFASNVQVTKENVDRYQSLTSDQQIESVGIYPVRGQSNRWVAFQPVLEESKTNSISQDAWDQLGLPEFDESITRAQVERIRINSDRESAANIEERQQIWQWLLWVVLGLLAVESVLAITSPRGREATT
ncbi:BatA domain-containing protein [Pelagicoccus sp. SDUM812002]|uniref:BatA domain-containing protein n=1 Tax=Pelagicoccus sp. SDUM812002 TaxID=3041266 RepID=UPI00280E2D73|nr:BatA domain-containing protein [Pelagicoccus sp. SDUM812002]MDQ8184043.1 BatA domain-containing protein [Pelagicoccus sp. SDUM812002]